MLQEIELDELESDAGFLQSASWGRIKEGYAWQARAYCFNSVKLLVLYRELGLGFRIAYVPHGPHRAMDMPFFKSFAESLKLKLPPRTVLIRFDLPWERSAGNRLKKPFRKSAVEIQPPDTVILDITPSAEQLLAAMKKKTRYNIRLAEKKGVCVRQEGRDKLDLWYALYRETAVRDRIAIHPLAYYRSVLEGFSTDANARPFLFLAYVEEQAVAGIIVLLYAKRASYLYGASADSFRSFMPNYLLQWQAILTAREAGCLSYDFFGIPPADDPGHPMHGLYRFKTGFGGDIVHYAGCWDLPVNVLACNAYRLLERLRNFYYKVLLKRR